MLLNIYQWSLKTRTDKNLYLTSAILIKDIRRATPAGYKVQSRALILQCVNCLYFVDKSVQKKQIRR